MSDDFPEQIEFDQMETEEKPKRSIWVIILVVLLVIVCCCLIIALAVWAAWTYGDQWFGFATPVLNAIV